MPWLPVTAIDVRDQRVANLERVAAGGVATLTAARANVTDLPFADQSFDVVTMLEVLEHIPDTAAALRSALRVARRFALLSVPARPVELYGKSWDFVVESSAENLKLTIPFTR